MKPFARNNTLLAALTLAVLVTASALGCSTPRPPKVVVIGLDGLTWKFLDPLLRDHQLLNIESVLRGAAYGELDSFRPSKSAILWTSIATGKTREKHGITDWTSMDLRARKEIERLRLVTGIDRTAATIWEILGDKGYSVDVTNWWVTYPARPVNGVLVTDRLKALVNKRSVADDPDVVYPASILAELRPFFLRKGEAEATERKYGFPLFTPARADEMFNTSKPSRGLYASLESYVGQDQMVASWALHLLKKSQPDFFAVLLRITDVFGHFGYRFADRATLEKIIPQIGVENLANQDMAVRQKAQHLVEELDPLIARAMLPAYKLADSFVGAIVSAMDPDSLLLIVSDHGFEWAGGSYGHKTAPPGVIILKGKEIRPGRIKGAKLFDVTPTILYALREPVARDMDGRALTTAFGGRFGERRERFVDTYGPGARQVKGASASHATDEEILKDLRTLGYLDSAPDTDQHSSSGSKR